MERRRESGVDCSSIVLWGGNCHRKVRPYCFKNERDRQHPACEQCGFYQDCGVRPESNGGSIPKELRRQK